MARHGIVIGTRAVDAELKVEASDERRATSDKAKKASEWTQWRTLTMYGRYALHTAGIPGGGGRMCNTACIPAVCNDDTDIVSHSSSVHHYFVLTMRLDARAWH